MVAFSDAMREVVNLAERVAKTGAREILETAAGTGLFTVILSPPAILSVNPNTGQQGQQNLSAAIAGQFTHFVQGTTTANFGAGIALASPLTVNSATTATAVLNIDPAAATGARNVTLTTGGGS